MKGKAKGNRRKNALAALCFATALVLLLSSAGATLAKYLRKDQGSGLAVAAPFYFVSDKLGEPDSSGNYPYVQISDPGEGGSAVVEFDLSNYVDKLRRTGGEISYTITAVAGSVPAAEVSGGQAVSWTGTEASGTLAAGGDNTASVSMSIPRESFGSAQTVTVTAASSEPYARTIGAQFGFTPQQRELQWAFTDKGSAVVLEIAGGSGKNVTVTWPATLSPDLSNDAFRSAVQGSTTFLAEPGVRYALTFLKTDPTKHDYTVKDFGVTEESSG